MIKTCPYPSYSGVEDTEVISGYCEIGCKCYSECQYSWKQDEETKVNKIFETYKPRGHY